MGEATTAAAGPCWSPWRYLRDRYPHVVVIEAKLPPGWMGCVDPTIGAIWIAEGLTQAERRCTVAHELGHLRRGLVCNPTAADAEEKAVDEWASRKLITITDLCRAFQWSSHLDEIADELWVDKHMLRARLRALTDDEQDQVMDAIRRSRGAA